MSSPRGRVHVVPPLLSMVAVFMAAAVMVATAQMFRPGIMQQNDDEHIISRRSQECSDKQTADLYLLVDGSSSVGPRNFHLVLRFLAKLVDKLDIGKDKVRVGMVQYSGNMRSPRIKKEFNMGQYADKKKLKAAILRTKYMRGFTFTGAALRHTLQLFKRQGRPGVGKILVLVTDGEANDKVKDPSDEVKSSGIVLFSVGVGKADRKELALMASPPVDKHMFHATNFAGLDSIITTLTSTVCTVVQEAQTPAPVTAATQAVTLPSKGAGGLCSAVCFRDLLDAFSKVFVVNADLMPFQKYLNILTPLVLLTARPTLFPPTFDRATCDCLLKRLTRVSGRDARLATALTLAGPTLALTECSDKQTADLYLLVDGSSSVGRRNFHLVLRFLAKLVDKLDIGKDKVRVGMVQYSGNMRSPRIKKEFNMGQYADKKKLKAAILRTKYMRGFTFTGAALRHTLQLFKRQGRPGVGKILVLVTDGEANDKVKDPSDEVKSSGIVLFSVGVGKADRKELALMASPPVDKHMFHATNFAGLDSIITTLTSTVCTVVQEAQTPAPVTAATQAVTLPSKGAGGLCSAVCFRDLLDAFSKVFVVNADLMPFQKYLNILTPLVLLTARPTLFPPTFDRATCDCLLKRLTRVSGRDARLATALTLAGPTLALTECSDKQTADLYLLVDGSSSVGRRNFHLVLRFLAKLVDKLDIGKDKVRVGMVQYSGNMRSPRIKKEFNMGQYADKKKLKAAILRTKYMRGFTFTGAALRHTLQLFKRQGRPGVGKILVLVTDGEANDKVKDPSDEVKSSGIVLFSVGVGKADRKELALMASPPVDKHMFHATNFAGLDSIITTLTSTVCTVVQEAQTPAPVTAATQAVTLPSKGAGGLCSAVCFRDLLDAFSKVFVVNADLMPFQKYLNILTPLVLLTARPTLFPPTFDRATCDCLLKRLTRVSGRDARLATALTLAGPTLALTECSDKQTADLYLLVDGSSSVGRRNFHLVLRFLAKLVDKLDIGKDKVRVGMVQYSGNMRSPRIKKEFNMGQYADKKKLKAAILRTKYMRGFTFTGAALRHTLQLFKRQGRPGVGKILVLVTDGEANDKVKDPSDEVKSSGIVLFSVGVGKADRKELALMASPPVDKHMFHATNFAGLDSIITTLTSTVCTVVQEAQTPAPVTAATQAVTLPSKGAGGLCSAVCDKQTADLYLLVDGSSSVGRRNFHLVLRFLAKLVDKLDIGKDKVRVGMVQYSGNMRSPRIKKEFDMGQYADKKKLKAAIQGTKYMRGFTFTGAALRHTLQLFKRQGRPGVGKILVLVTDGEANDKVKDPSDEVKSSGIVLFSVGVGKADRKELALMASPPVDKHMFHATNFAGLDSIITTLTSTVCTVVQEAQTPAPTPPPGPFAKLDVIFAIDGSAGVAAADFTLMKGFVAQIVQGLSVGAAQVRVGLVQLSGKQGSEFKLGQFSSRQEVVAAVGKVSAHGGGRAIGATVQFALATAFSQAEGGRAGEGVPQVLVIITGGASSDAVAHYRGLLRAHGVRSFVIGIGAFQLLDLQRLPSDPIGLHLYAVGGYAQLLGIAGQVTSVIVRPAISLDLVFMVDGSLGAAWGAVRAFVSHLLLYVQGGGGVLRVAFVQFAGDVTVELYLDQGTEVAAVLAKLQSVQQLSGAGGRNLGKAVSFVGGTVLSAAKGGRGAAGVNQVVVLFVAGPSTDEPSQALYALKASGVRVLALDLGGLALAQLGGLVSTPFNLHYYKLSGGAQVLPLALGRILHTSLYAGVTRGAQYADIVFYLDSSATLGAAGFVSLKAFLVQVLSYLQVGRYTVRVAVVQVGGAPVAAFQFNSHSERSALVAAVSQLKAVGGARNVGAALSLGYTTYFSQASDAGLQPAQVGILLTGGASADNAAKAAAQLQASGVRLFVVGVGSGVDQALIQGVASFPYALHSFTVSDYTGLSKVVVTSLVKYIFRPVVSGDLVFLIDGSTSVEQQTFHLIKKFVERIITNYYYIGGSLRVAVYQFGGAGRLEVPLGNQNDADSLTHTISNIEKVSGPRNLGASLTYVLSNIYKETTTTKLSQSIFIISGGKSDDDVTGAVQLLRERGITVTGVGHTSSQLDAVVSTSSHWFKFTESGTILKSFYNIISGLFFTVPVVPIPKTTQAPTTTTTTTTKTAPTTTTLAPTTPKPTTKPAPVTTVVPVTVPSPYSIGEVHQLANVHEYHRTCRDHYSRHFTDNRYGDVVFVVDGSSGISAADFGTVRTIVSQIITGLQVGPDNTRVALVTIGGTPKVDIFLNSLSGKAELLTAVEKLVPVGGPLNLGAALQVVVNSVLKPEKGSRIHLGAPTMLVTILGGKPADDVSGSVVTLNGLGVRHVVLSGGYQDTKVLDSIATSSRLVKTWSSFQSILNFNLGHFVYKTKEKASVVFVVDTSTITADELKVVKTFIVGIAHHLNLAPDSVRLSVVSYGANYQKLVGPAEINSPKHLEAKLGSVLVPTGGATNTGKALTYTITDLLAKEPADVSKSVVLITSGPSSDSVAPIPELLQKHVVSLFAVGVKSSDVKQLQTLVSRGGYYYQLSDYSLLSMIHSQIIIKALYLPAIQQAVTTTVVTNEFQYKLVPGNRDADVVFVVDGSSEVSDANFALVRTIVSQIIAGLDVGPDATRVALVTVGGTPRADISFNSFPGKAKLLAAVGKLAPAGGPRNLGAALQLVANSVLKPDKGSRSQLGSTTIVYTILGGKPADDVTAGASLLRGMGVLVSAFGAGYKDSSVLSSIATSSSQVFTWSSFQDLVTKSSSLTGNSLYLPKRKASVTFVVDTSSTITADELKVVKTFIVGMANRLNLAPDSVRLSVVSYGADYQKLVGPAEINSPKHLEAKLGSVLVPTGGATNTGKALTYTITDLLAKEPEDATKSVVLITSGPSSDSVAPIAELLQKHVVSLFAVGVKSSDVQQLHTLVSRGGYYYQLSDYSLLFRLQGQMVNKVLYLPAIQKATTTIVVTKESQYKVVPGNRDADVVFVVDGSSEVSDANFALVRTIVSQIIAGLDVGPDATRVALVTVGGTPRADISFDSFPGKAELLAAVGKLAPAGGPRNLGAALQLVANSVLKPDKGSRSQLGSTTIVYTILGGKPADDVTAGASLLRGMGVLVSAFGAGYQDSSVLSSIATSSSQVFTWSSFQDLVTKSSSLTGNSLYLPKRKASVTFVVDTSSTITADELKVVKTFIVGMANRLNLAPDSVRLSVVSYGADYQKLVGPAEINSPKHLEAKLGSVLVPTGGATNTGKALTYTITDLLAKEPEDATKSVVLITSGPSSDSVAPIAELLQKHVVSLFAVGVKSSDVQQLHTLVSRGGYYYQLSDYSLLFRLQGQMVNKVLYLPAIQKATTTIVVTKESQYKVVPGNRDADVVFVVDGSSEVSDANFALVRTIVSQIIAGLDVGPDATRVALVTVGGTPRADISFDSFPGKAELLAAVGKLAPAGGPRNLGAALQLVANSVLKPDKGSRSQLGSTTIVYTILGGKPADDVTAGASLLRGMGVLVSAFGAGYQDSSVLSSIATSSSQVFTWSSFQDLVTKSSSLTGNSLYLPKRKASVTFVVDTSSTITADELKVVKTFIVGMANRLNLAPDSVRLSVVSYGADYQKLVGPAEINSPKHLETKLGSVLVPTGGATNTGKALTYTITDLLAKEPEDATKSVVLITSGPSSDSVAPIAELLQKHVVSLFAVGVKSSNVQQLHTLVSRGGYYYQLSDYSLLFRLQGQMVNKVLYLPAIQKATTTIVVTKESQYKVVPGNRDADVVFVVDGSSEVSDANFALVRTIVSQIIAGLDVGPDATRVALVTVGGTPRADISFNLFPGKAELLAAVGKLAPAGGPRNLGAALQLVANSVLKPDKGSRIQLGSTTIVYTILGGKPADDVTAGASLLRGMGVLVSAFGAGYKDSSVLSSIATSSSQVFTWSSFQDLVTKSSSLTGNSLYLPKSKASVTFVVDTSSTITADELKVVKKFIVGMANRLNLAPDSVRLSVVSYGADYQKLVGPAEINSPKDLETKLGSVLVPTGGATNTGKALTYAITDLLAKEPEDATKSVVLITSGPSSDSVAPIAELLQKHVVSLFAVGVKSSDVQQLQTLVSRGGYYYQLSDYSLLFRLQGQMVNKALYLPAIVKAENMQVVIDTTKLMADKTRIIGGGSKGLKAITCTTTAKEFLTDSAAVVFCPPGCQAVKGYKVKGSYIYSLDSMVCVAAAHAGVVIPEVGGVVRVVKKPGVLSFDGSVINSISSHAAPGEPLSFVFKGCPCA
uniref:Uncharacterized protein LOC116955350 n=1 Tax=Petromyzon marinus TaxID=7757 RepID=A0AAJ7UCH9_PETMA|nr:uncharacterized protein LOC116955350 [Petromyzon marinus]